MSAREFEARLLGAASAAALSAKVSVVPSKDSSKPRNGKPKRVRVMVVVVAVATLKLVEPL